jgi:uncharacterized repeat protein (TIGR01451 family)
MVVGAQTLYAAGAGAQSPTADLAITKTDGVTSVTPGGGVTYTVTASNAGPSNAPGASVVDVFPAASRRGPPEPSDELIDELLAGARTADEIAGEGGLLQTLTKRLIERAMDAELTDHLGYPRGQAP